VGCQAHKERHEALVECHRTFVPHCLSGVRQQQRIPTFGRDNIIATGGGGKEGIKSF
jgi:hypothetical protein